MYPPKCKEILPNPPEGDMIKRDRCSEETAVPAAYSAPAPAGEL